MTHLKPTINRIPQSLHDTPVRAQAAMYRGIPSYTIGGGASTQEGWGKTTSGGAEILQAAVSWYYPFKTIKRRAYHG